jgi:hypothetical protein
MAESATHRQLVDDLAELLQAVGFAVLHRDSAGHRRPWTISGYRPDLFGKHVLRRERVVAEAKVGRDLFTDHSLTQFEKFSGAMLPVSPARFAHLVVAVPSGQLADAWRALGATGIANRRVTVAARERHRWLITSRPLDGAGSWPGFAVATPVLRSPYAARFSQRVSEAGAATDEICRGGPT